MFFQCAACFGGLGLAENADLKSNNITQERQQEQEQVEHGAVALSDRDKDKDSTNRNKLEKKRYTRQELSFSKLTAKSDAGANHLKLEYPELVPFSIEDCKDCNLFLFSCLSQCTIDACQNCFIFVGPSEGPVFIRDCSDCVIVVACQQLRLRDCRNVKLSLYAKGQPIIESSSDITFARFTYDYPALRDQFQKANLNLDAATTEWNVSVYDFTPSQTAQENMKVLEGPLDQDLLKVPPVDMVNFTITIR